MQSKKECIYLLVFFVISSSLFVTAQNCTTSLDCNDNSYCTQDECIIGVCNNTATRDPSCINGTVSERFMINYFIKPAQLSTGYRRILSLTERLQFNSSGKIETIKISNITDESVSIKLNSTNKSLNLFIGEEKSFDLDPPFKLAVKLENITSARAHLFLKLYQAAISNEPANLNQTNLSQNTTQNNTKNQTSNKSINSSQAQQKDSKITINKTTINLFIIIGIILAVGIVFIYFVNKSRKKSEIEALRIAMSKKN